MKNTTITADSLLENKELRDGAIERIEVLDKVKQLFLIPELECMTVKQVADYYEIPLSTVNDQYQNNKLEFDEDYENPRHNEIDYIIKDTEGYYHSKYCPDGYDLELCKRDCTKIYICDELGNDLSDIVFDITSNIDIVNKYDSSVEIVSQGNNYIEVKNLYGYNGSDLIITFEKDNIKILIKIKLSR